MAEVIRNPSGGSGDVVGPSSSVDNAIVRFDSTTGKLVQGYTSGEPTIDDTGNLFIANASGVVIGHTGKLNFGEISEFQILGTDGSDSQIAIGRFSANSFAAAIRLAKSRNATIGSNTIVQDNDGIGIIVFMPDDGTDFATAAARFGAEVDDASPAAGDIGMAFTWEQMPGGGGALAETMRLSAAGVLTLVQGQLAFPATQVASANANTLDDYEEGTFTPQIADVSLDGSGEGQAYTVQVGRYTKIGDHVFFSIHLQPSSLGTLTTSDGARIVGLPFTSNSTTNSNSAVMVGLGGTLAIPVASENVVGRIDPNVTHIRLALWDATTGTTDLLLSELSADGQLIVSGHYGV